MPRREEDSILLHDEMYLAVSCCMHSRSSDCWGPNEALLAQPSPRYGGIAVLFVECCLPILRWWLNASSPPEWMEELLSVELAPWQNRPIIAGDMDQFEAKHEDEFCRFRIRSGGVSGCKQLTATERSWGCHRGKHILATFSAALQILGHLKNLPDVDFFLSCVEDFSRFLQADPPVPLLAQVRQPWASSALRVPHSHFLSTWSRRMEYEVPVVDSPWEKKSERAVFRGAPGGPRPQFLAGAAEAIDPKIIDARLVTEDAEERRTIESLFPSLANASLWGQPLSLQQQLSFRYILDIDGGGGPSDRFLWSGLSESVPLRVASQFESWIGALVQPFEHFIPVREDGADLGERLAWILASEGEARRVALASRRLVQQKMGFEHALHWVFRLLQGLAVVQHHPPTSHHTSTSSL